MSNPKGVSSAPRRWADYGTYALAGMLASFAYLALWLGGRSPWSRYLDHRLLGSADDLGPMNPTIFVLGWTVMVAAMMLPTAVPLFEAFARVTSRRPERTRLLLLLAAGFVGVWAAFGYALTWADLLVHLVVDRVEVLAERPQFLGAAVLVAAGMYQFTGLKRQCLSQCRSPRSLIMRRWSGRRATADALRVGVDYGLSCLGCCWTLMLVVFALGTGNVGIMLAFGLVMAIEKNVPRARAVTPAMAVVLVAAGIAVVLAAAT